MTTTETERVDWGKGTVPVAWHHPAKGKTYLVLAHGAGGTMDTPSLVRYAEGLAAEGIGAARFNFPYSEAKKKSPDRAAVLEASWRAVAEHVARRADTLLLGGRSMGGRYASHLVAEGFDTAGLVFLSYPLHPPGKPDRLRDEHLYGITVPMLFLQGTKDPFSTPELLEGVVAKLKDATLHPIEGGNHSHRVKGRPEAEVVAELVEATVNWLAAVTS